LYFQNNNEKGKGGRIKRGGPAVWKKENSILEFETSKTQGRISGLGSADKKVSKEGKVLIAKHS